MRALRLIVLIAIIGILLVFVPGLVQRINAQSAIPDATVAVYLLRMRAAPSNRGAVVASLPEGTTITLDGRDASSRWLHGQADTGAVGWVSRAYLSLRLTLSVSGLPIMNSSAQTASGNESTVTHSNSTATPRPPAPITGGHVTGGFEVGGQVQGLGANTVAAMQQAGMKWVKQQVQMGDGNAVGLIAGIHAAGFKALLSVVGNKDSVVDSGYQSAYAGYVGDLAKQGADAIEIWNEMNIDREWKTGSINPALYVNLLAKSYNAIKASHPSTIVISGALAPTGAEGAFGSDRVWNDDHYYAGMAAAGAGSYADCIGVHYNEGIVGPYQTSGDPRGNYPTRYFSTMLARALAPFRGKQACFTELGYLTPEGYPPLPGSFAWAQNTTVAEQAAWLAQAAVRASSSHRVRLMIIFNVDFTLYGADPQAGYAMIRPGGGCPTCQTLGQVLH